MSDNDELARLRGEIAALKDVLVATIRRARGLDPTSAQIPGGPKIVRAIIKNIDAEFFGRASIHSDNTVLGESEEWAAYTKMLEEIKQALRGV